jgi:predicted Holliday junction resolvase-like endonuclease
LSDLLATRGLFVRCPSCDEEFAVQRAKLFDATRPLPEYASAYLGSQRDELREATPEIRAQRAELKRRSFTSAASSGIGQTLEMLTPSLPGFPVGVQDCRSLLKPIDYIAFRGASEGRVTAIAFIEVKTGKQPLSRVQKQVQAAVLAGKVRMRVADHRLPDQSASE